MKVTKLNKTFKTIEQATKKHSPEILLGLGIAGGISTTVLAVKATPKALMLIDDEKRARRANNESDILKPVEVVKTAWKPYVPAAVTGAVSIACIIGAHSVNASRNAALATAYKLTETAFTEYRDAVIEQIGEKKEQEVNDRIAEKKIRENPVETKEVIVTDRGNVLFYDSISSRYFESDLETVRKVVNDMNHILLTQDYISLNEFYYDLGLDQTAIGDELGWNINYGMIDIRYSSQITKNGKPCIVLNYRVAPRYDYASLM
jgi:hypothetical protein